MEGFLAWMKNNDVIAVSVILAVAKTSCHMMIDWAEHQISKILA